MPDIPAALWQRLPEADDVLHESAQANYEAQHVLATAGSQAAIQILPKLLLSPCKVAMYAEHAKNWLAQGHEVYYFDHEPDAQLLEHSAVLLLCNPNNPTGQFYEPETLLKWHAQLAQEDDWLVLDYAFMDCTPEYSLAKYSQLPHLIILLPLGKFFGLAGARVRFVLAEKSVLNALEYSLEPWPIASPARFIAIQALQDITWQTSTRISLVQQSARLNALLSQYGLRPNASTALFQWLPHCSAQAIHESLASQGIWIRYFADWNALRFGLPPQHGWARLETPLLALS